jgi:hypothetical protein
MQHHDISPLHRRSRNMKRLFQHRINLDEIWANLVWMQ